MRGVVEQDEQQEIEHSGQPRHDGEGPPSPPRRLLVVVPAFNEERSIGGVLWRLRREGYDTLVVDDGSFDRTTLVARKAGAASLRLCINSGVGGALHAGFRWAVAHGYDTVVQCDADGQHRPEEISTLLAAAPPLPEPALVIGSRFLDGDERRRSSGAARAVAMRTLSSLASRTSRSRITDASSGFRLIQGDLLVHFSQDYPSEYLGDTVEAVAMAGRRAARVLEVPVRMDVRAHGTSSARTIAAIWYTLRVAAAVLLGADNRTHGHSTMPLPLEPFEPLELT